MCNVWQKWGKNLLKNSKELLENTVKHKKKSNPHVGFCCNSISKLIQLFAPRVKQVKSFLPELCFK